MLSSTQHRLLAVALFLAAVVLVLESNATIEAFRIIPGRRRTKPSGTSFCFPRGSRPSRFFVDDKTAVLRLLVLLTIGLAPASPIDSFRMPRRRTTPAFCCPTAGAITTRGGELCSEDLGSEDWFYYDFDENDDDKTTDDDCYEEPRDRYEDDVHDNDAVKLIEAYMRNSRPPTPPRPSIWGRFTTIYRKHLHHSSRWPMLVGETLDDVRDNDAAKLIEYYLWNSRPPTPPRPTTWWGRSTTIYRKLLKHPMSWPMLVGETVGDARDFLEEVYGTDVFEFKIQWRGPRGCSFTYELRPNRVHLIHDEGIIVKAPWTG